MAGFTRSTTLPVPPAEAVAEARAALAEPSIGALLPCDVVVRSLGDTRTLVEVVAPSAMMAAAQSERPNAVLDEVAEEAGRRLDAVLEYLDRDVRCHPSDAGVRRP